MSPNGKTLHQDPLTIHADCGIILFLANLMLRVLTVLRLMSALRLA